MWTEVFGGRVCTTVTVTGPGGELPGPEPEPDPEPPEPPELPEPPGLPADPLEPEPPSMGTTE